jgi:Outer membrane protein beta-barrel domain
VRNLGSSGVISLVGLVAALTAGPAYAQSSTNERPAVGIGYQFVHFNADIGGLNYPIGFNVDVSGPLPGSHGIGIVGELGWSRHSETAFTENQVAFDGGVRGSFPAGTTSAAYLQATFGVQHGSSTGGFSTTDALFAIDGGVNISAGTVGDFFVQGGYRRVFYEGSGENAFRVVVGVRVPVGGR